MVHGRVWHGCILWVVDIRRSGPSNGRTPFSKVPPVLASFCIEAGGWRDDTVVGVGCGEHLFGFISRRRSC